MRHAARSLTLLLQSGCMKLLGTVLAEMLLDEPAFPGNLTLPLLSFPHPPSVGVTVARNGAPGNFAEVSGLASSHVHDYMHPYLDL